MDGGREMAGPAGEIYPFTSMAPCRLVNTLSDGSGAFGNTTTRTYTLTGAGPYGGCAGLGSISPKAYSVQIAFKVAAPVLF